MALKTCVLKGGEAKVNSRRKMGLEEMDLDLPQSSAKGHFLMRPDAFQLDDIAVHVKDRKPRIVRFDSPA